MLFRSALARSSRDRESGGGGKRGGVGGGRGVQKKKKKKGGGGGGGGGGARGGGRGKNYSVAFAIVMAFLAGDERGAQNREGEKNDAENINQNRNHFYSPLL